MSKSHNCGFLSLLYSISDNPLGLWSKHVSSDGKIRRIEDSSLNGDKVIEISGPENSLISTSLSCPANPEDCLNIQLPVLVIVIKNLKSRVQIAFQVIDEENIRRKFILSSFENGKTTGTETARIPLKLDEGWNLLEINLATLCQSTYRTEYRALQRLIIYPNCRLRRIYLQDRHYEQNETPVELCQAFFDMYMLKWGIHFVEKSCQTNETFNDIKNDEEISASISENPLRSGESLSKSRLVTPIRRSAKKRDSSSNDSSVNGDDKKKNFRTERQIKKSAIEEDRKGLSLSEIVSTQMKFGSDKEGDIFRKWPYNYGRLQQILQRKTTSSAQTRGIQTVEAAKDSIIINSLSSTFLDRKSNGLARFANTSSGLRLIPSVVEAASAETTGTVESTKSKLLTTDEAVGDFLELRHVINRKMLESFRVRGLTMTEVELSIYNSKHRKNSYGQGKLVRKHRISVDKACHVTPSDDTMKKPRKKSAVS